MHLPHYRDWICSFAMCKLATEGEAFFATFTSLNSSNLVACSFWVEPLQLIYNKKKGKIGCNSLLAVALLQNFPLVYIWVTSNGKNRKEMREKGINFFV